MGATRAALNRKVRQEALRDQLAEQCRLQHVLDNIKKMETQGASMESTELQAMKAATEARLKLINKYLPDLKQQEIEHSGNVGLTDMSEDELNRKLAELTRELG